MTTNLIASNQANSTPNSSNPNPTSAAAVAPGSAVAPADASVSPEEESAEFAAAFARVEHEILAVSEDDVLPINVDVPTVVAMVTGSLPELRELRGALAALPAFEVGRFDKLRDYALALAHTHARFRGASGPENRVAELGEEVAELRDILQADATALARRKILDAGQIEKLRGGSGYKNIAFEVAGLVDLFRERWSEIQGRSALQLEELEHAGRKAQELVIAVGVREQGPGTVNAVMLLRQRAFTLLANAYDHVRRGVGYLRWDKNDADSIAPSLYAGRGGKPGVMPTPVKPPVSGGDAPAIPPVSAGTNPAPSTSNPALAGTGLPGSSPFQRS
jgi:hypothetical protein